MADKAKVLVVANQTAESEELLAALKARGDQGNVEFTVLIPATPHGVSWAADMSAGEEEAAYHRKALVERLRSIGLDVKDAKVGDADALAAIQDEVNFADYDELIVSTLPKKISRWLHLDLPRKVEAATGPAGNAHHRACDEGAGQLGSHPPVDLEEHSIDPVIERTCAECGAKLTDQEIQASLDAGGPFLCSVHAAEEVPLEDSEPEG